MLVDDNDFKDLLSMRREIKRLTNVIVTSLDRRKVLKKEMEETWERVEQEQLRLPYDEAEATERAPRSTNGNGNGHRGKRKAGTDGARA